MYTLFIVNESTYELHGEDSNAVIFRFNTLQALADYIDTTERHVYYPVRYEIERVE